MRMQFVALCYVHLLVSALCACILYCNAYVYIWTTHCTVYNATYCALYVYFTL